jgi:hypothetical protein
MDGLPSSGYWHRTSIDLEPMLKRYLLALAFVLFALLSGEHIETFDRVEYHRRTHATKSR